MSANLQESGGVVVLPPMGTLTPDEIMNASSTRWIWNPYRSISNMGALGIKRQIGYSSARWTTIERCNVYPLGNVAWNVEDIEALIDQAQGGLSITGPAPQKPFTKYALDQAREMFQAYEDYGLRVLEVFTGEDDPTVVNRIFLVVQPRVFKLHEMDAEFGPKATVRIEDSDLKPAERLKAEALRELFRVGGQRALVEAKREYQELIASMGKASVGQPGIATPNEFHEWLCDQLGVPCPSPIDKSPRQNTRLEGAIELLANRALREESAAESMIAELQQEREARAALETRLAALEDTKAHVKK